MAADGDTIDPRARSDDDKFTDLDYEMAEEIATFLAKRAYDFEDYDCRAWALNDFGVWAALAGRTPTLELAGHDLDKGAEGPDPVPPGDSGEPEPRSREDG